MTIAKRILTAGLDNLKLISGIQCRLFGSSSKRLETRNQPKYASTETDNNCSNETPALSYGSHWPALQKDKVRVYSMRFCPYAQRVKLVLAAKNIPYNIVNIDLHNKPDWFLVRTPLDKVPVVELNNGQILFESLVIADYFDDVYPERKLNPTDALERANNSITLQRFHQIAISIVPVYKGEISISEWWLIFQDKIQYLEETLRQSGKPFFGGDKLGMVDCMIWPWFERVEALTIAYNLKPWTPKRFHFLQKWMEHMSEDKSVQGVMVGTEDHIGYLNTVKTGKPDYDYGL